MPLENANFISELVESNPPGADFVLQGDDHIRMIKKVLRQTFPNADRALAGIGAGTLNISGDTALTINHDGFLIVVDTTNQNVTITLPILSVDDAGWKVYIVKNDQSDNFVLIQPQTGLIVGEEAIQLRSYFGYAVVHWSGTEWVGALTETGYSRGIAVASSRALEPFELGGVVFATPTGGDLTLTLPAIADADGRWAYFKNMSVSDNVIITPVAGETIEGRTKVTLVGQHKTVLLLATESGWFILTGMETEQTLFQELTFAASMPWDLDLGPNIKFTLTGNGTLQFPTNVAEGMSGFIAVFQDAVGGRELDFGGGFNFGNNPSGLSVDPLAPTLFWWAAVSPTSILVARLYTQGAVNEGEGFGLMVFAAAVVSEAGALLKGKNIGVVKASTGVYTISFGSAAPNSNFVISLAAAEQHLHTHYSGRSTGGFTVNIVRNIEGSNLTQYTPEDAEFSVLVTLVG